MTFFQGKMGEICAFGGTEKEGAGDKNKAPKRKETINPSKKEVIESKEQHKIKKDKNSQRQK